MKLVVVSALFVVVVIVGYNWLEDNRAGQCVSTEVAEVCAPTTTRNRT